MSHIDTGRGKCLLWIVDIQQQARYAFHRKVTALEAFGNAIVRKDQIVGARLLGMAFPASGSGFASLMAFPHLYSLTALNGCKLRDDTMLLFQALRTYQISIAWLRTEVTQRWDRATPWIPARVNASGNHMSKLSDR